MNHFPGYFCNIFKTALTEADVIKNHQFSRFDDIYMTTYSMNDGCSMKNKAAQGIKFATDDKASKKYKLPGK